MPLPTNIGWSLSHTSNYNGPAEVGMSAFGEGERLGASWRMIEVYQRQ
jgi:hypothetical protein